MFLRTLPYLAAVALLSTFSAACAGESDATDDEQTAASADELSSSLRNMTIVKGSVAEGAEVTVRYQPDLYSTDYLPFLAIEITKTQQAAPTGGLSTLSGELAPLSVNVDGAFPGAPRVLVVDEQFHVLASANGVTRDGNAHATINVPQSTSPGRKFILVRDRHWVLPMDFQVSTISR